ncbi:hypothetical protein DYB38_004486 [Aphanomyces astaci]|uniref:Uncharacterized protein n=2 Tax=Aphanomyces astaci TaxID=112090 RepID=A0A397ARI7_APHAT|nr:hypothetical protein DYB36_001773 [Aphanomyces astaci]RHY47854.1 hypothetical protein DYB34_000043 [Aphanomyces astaci]RHY54067.1 hypothetical protein DYB38_004486 [Aphanomyces astaci]
MRVGSLVLAAVMATTTAGSGTKPPSASGHLTNCDNNNLHTNHIRYDDHHPNNNCDHSDPDYFCARHNDSFDAEATNHIFAVHNVVHVAVHYCTYNHSPRTHHVCTVPVHNDSFDAEANDHFFAIHNVVQPTLDLASTDKGTSTGTYLGIGAGVLAGLGLIGAIIYFLLKRQNDDNNDDDQVSPGFKDLGNDPTYGAPAPVAYKANPPPQKYEPTKLAPANYTVHEPQPQPSPSPVPILQAPTVEYHNIHTNNSTILNTFRSAQEDNDFEEAHPHGSNRHMNEGGAYGGGGKVWTSAKHEDSHGEVGFDPEFESSSYNSSANQSAFNDDYDLQSEGSRDSSFGTRNSFQSHMSSDLDHNDFPVHKEPSAAERGSYEL